MTTRVASAVVLAFTLALDTPSFGQSVQSAAIDRALRANVMIEAPAGSSDQRTVASGVILQMRDGVAWIVTARHVVDRAFAGTMRAEQPALDSLRGISVVTVDRQRAAATVQWIAPGSIDLAVVSAPLHGPRAEPASWDRAVTPSVAAAVFTVGNPGGAGWVRADGTLAQMRDDRRDGRASRILWTNLYLEPGNSGGGLYDTDGRLIGINSLGAVGNDPRFPGGLGLSTALSTLLDLAPQQLGLE